MRGIQTERLFLEVVTLTNCKALWEVMQAPDLREYQDIPRYTLEEFRRRVAARPNRLHARATGRFEWLIRVRATNESVGWISLRIGEFAAAGAELGYSLLEAGRGNGYATEGVCAVLDEALLAEGLASIEAACVVSNAASCRVLDHLEFKRARLQRNGAVVRGKSVDIYIFRMESEHWKKMRGRINSSAK